MALLIIIANGVPEFGVTPLRRGSELLLIFIPSAAYVERAQGLHPTKVCFFDIILFLLRILR